MKSILATNKFDNIECNFWLKTCKPKVTLESLSQSVESLAQAIDNIAKEMKAMEQRIMSRIDNLVAKNNLKE